MLEAEDPLDQVNEKGPGLLLDALSVAVLPGQRLNGTLLMSTVGEPTETVAVLNTLQPLVEVTTTE
jgi:hypothetical protein